MNKLSRREFLAFSFTPVLVPIAAASSHDARLSALPSPSDAPAVQPEEELGAGDECPGCGGWGSITCPACDGTGMWTEASESAGLYQREAARAIDHCAWCNDGGEVQCPDCEGIRIPLSLFDSSLLNTAVIQRHDSCKRDTQDHLSRSMPGSGEADKYPAASFSLASRGRRPKILRAEAAIRSRSSYARVWDSWAKNGSGEPHPAPRLGCSSLMPWQRPRGVANGAHRKSGVIYRLTSACPAES